MKLKVNDYKRKVFGGIQDLELSIVNNSGYILDNVEVELHYLKPSELVLKTEKIHFSNIAPNGSMTKKIPDSQRGIKVTYEIKNIESSQYDKSLAGN